MGKRNINPKTPSPVKRKKQRRLHLLSPTVDLIEQNDDDSELLEEDRANTFSEGMVGMSEKQLKDHYEICLQLAAANKINTKNAFSLKLIDLLDHFFHSENSSSINFMAAGSALGASTVIYSYRVDHVHSQVVRLVTAMSTHTPVTSQESPSSRSRKPDTTSRKHATISSKSQLMRIPLCEKLLPIEKMSGCCLMSSFPLQRPSEGIVLSKSQPVWPPLDDIDVARGHLGIQPHKYAPRNRPAKRRPIVSPLLPPASVPVSPMVIDSIDDIRDAASCPSPEMYQDSHISDLDEPLVERPFATPVPFNESELLLKNIQESDYHYLDSRKLPFVKTAEFWQYPKCFVDDVRDVSECDSTCLLTSQKSIGKEISYNRNTENLEDFNKKWKLSKSSLFKKWKSSELLLVNETLWQKNFRSLFCCQLIMKMPVAKCPDVTADENKEECTETSIQSMTVRNPPLNDEDSSCSEAPGDDPCNTSSRCDEDSDIGCLLDYSSEQPEAESCQSYISSQYSLLEEDKLVSSSPKKAEESYHSCISSQQSLLEEDKLVPTPPKKPGAGSCDSDISSEYSLLEGDNLVPAPPRKVLPKINYCLKPKKIDMRKMKDMFWSEFETQNKQVQRGACGGPVTFTDLLYKVRSKLPEEEAKDLSWQLAMVTLLHLANERNLHLFQRKATDFFIEGT